MNVPTIYLAIRNKKAFFHYVSSRIYVGLNREVCFSVIRILKTKRIKVLSYLDNIRSIAIKKNDKLSHKNYSVYFHGLKLSQALREFLSSVGDICYLSAIAIIKPTSR